MKIVITNGYVASAKVSGNSNPRLSRCLEEEARKWKFPRAPVDTKFDYPFVFKNTPLPTNHTMSEKIVESFKRGNYSGALSMCAAHRHNSAASNACAMAACRMRQRDKARRFAAGVRGSTTARALKQYCQRFGVILDR